jgi:hypothetical protein
MKAVPKHIHENNTTFIGRLVKLQDDHIICTVVRQHKLKKTYMHIMIPLSKIGSTMRDRIEIDSMVIVNYRKNGHMTLNIQGIKTPFYVRPTKIGEIKHE